MSAYAYPIALALISVVVAGLERLFPWRPTQRPLRRALWSDFVHLVFNGHFLGVIFYGVAAHHLLPPIDRWLASVGSYDAVYRGAATAWPLWLQILVALFVVDFVQWCVHNLLHRVPLFWEFHKAHHSVVDGEMDWIVSFRFQWTEVVVYKAVQYLPLAFFGFAPEAVLFHAIFGTLIGHLNHANLDLSWGPLKYLLNSPRMHIWHHDYDGDAKTTVNFGIIFSTWDWIFRTAKLPDEPPQKLGFAGVETFPTDFFSQAAWPLPALFREGRAGQLATSFAGVGLVASGFWLAQPPSASRPAAVVEGEGASSQPAEELTLASPEQAEAALARFGEDARREGHARPELMVSVPEVRAALGSPRLVLVDVRPEERYREGHIPSALQADRGAYSVSEPISGLSRPHKELEAQLRALGVRRDSVVVLYGDGGPEPYRMWWTLRAVGGYDARVLDGGLVAWKAAGLPAPAGQALKVQAGDVVLSGVAERPPLLWDELADVRAHPDVQIVDARSPEEHLGKQQHEDAAKPGRIPASRHLEWSRVLRDEVDDPRLMRPGALRGLFKHAGLTGDAPVLAYCQSGTRSSALAFALLQAGYAEENVVNYDGSWAEYSRLSLPTETGGDEGHLCTDESCPVCQGKDC